MSERALLLEARSRPPWTQELTRDEADAMLTAARAVGGEVAAWAVTVYYVQSALADQRDRFERAMRLVLSRHPRGCRVTYIDKATGWTCLDQKLHAEEFPAGYSAEYQLRLASGEELCDCCLIREALGGWEAHESLLAPCGRGRGRDVSGTRSGPRSAGLKPLGASTIRLAFASRHSHPVMRQLARSAIRDARVWRSIFGRTDGR